MVVVLVATLLAVGLGDAVATVSRLCAVCRLSRVVSTYGRCGIKLVSRAPVNRSSPQDGYDPKSREPVLTVWDRIIGTFAEICLSRKFEPHYDLGGFADSPAR